MKTLLSIDNIDESPYCLFHGVRGSRAYGTDIETSDTDTHGLYYLPVSEHMGLRDIDNQIQDEKGDNVFYELRRYFRLAMSANPNLIEILYAPKDCILKSSPVYDFLVANREKFISKRCYHSFSNYALAQIKKAKGKNKKVHGKDEFFREESTDKLRELFFSNKVSRDWIETRFYSGIFGFITKGEEYSNDLKGFKKEYDKYIDDDLAFLQPPKRTDHSYVFPVVSPKIRGYDEMPSRPIPLADFKRHYVDIETCHVSSVEHIPNLYRLYRYTEGDVKGVFKGDKVVCQSIPKDDEWMKYTGNLFVNEIAFQKSSKDYKSYWDWMANRNDSRWIDQESDDDLDFDRKNMQHTIRLLYSGINILEHGEPIVRFTGDQLKFLREIRDGKHGYKGLMALADELESLAKNLYEKSNLPDEVDQQVMDDLFEEMQKLLIDNS